MMLLFFVGEDCFALRFDHLVEVIPRVPLERFSSAESYLAGMLSWGGQSVPVVDLCQVIEGREAEQMLSTRIVLASQGKRVLGVIVERATDTTEHESEEFVQSGVRAKNLPFIGGSIMDERGSIHELLLDELFAYVAPIFCKESE